MKAPSKKGERNAAQHPPTLDCPVEQLLLSLQLQPFRGTIKHVDRQRARRQFSALRLNGDEDFGTDRT